MLKKGDRVVKVKLFTGNVVRQAPLGTLGTVMGPPTHDAHWAPDMSVKLDDPPPEAPKVINSCSNLWQKLDDNDKAGLNWRESLGVKRERKKEVA